MNQQPKAVINCPRCGNPTVDVIDVDPGLKTILKTTGAAEPPSRVCSACYNDLTNQVSQGVKLRIEQQAREKNKNMLWKSRVNLVKQARQMMNNKSFSEAALSYEKYLRVLEISYDLKPGALSPEVFGKSQRSKELTVIATTYWDLMRIYDSNPNYRDRMQNAAGKLAEFIPYSPIFPDVVKKAELFMGTARNPDIVKSFLRTVRASAGRCFIATSAFNDPMDETVLYLQFLRDTRLRSTPWGQAFIRSYYRMSPPVASYLDRHPLLKPMVRTVLRATRKILEKSS